jgi:hypothetical protein
VKRFLLSRILGYGMVAGAICLHVYFCEWRGQIAHVVKTQLGIEVRYEPSLLTDDWSQWKKWTERLYKIFEINPSLGQLELDAEDVFGVVEAEEKREAQLRASRGEWEPPPWYRRDRVSPALQSVAISPKSYSVVLGILAPLGCILTALRIVRGSDLSTRLPSVPKAAIK